MRLVPRVRVSIFFSDSFGCFLDEVFSRPSGLSLVTLVAAFAKGPKVPTLINPAFKADVLGFCTSKSFHIPYKCQILDAKTLSMSELCEES